MNTTNINSTIEHMATLIAIDVHLRVSVWEDTIFLSCKQAQTIMQRPPAIDTAHILSWGLLTLNEIKRLIQHEEDSQNTSYISIEDIEKLQTNNFQWSLFYPRNLNGK